MRKHLLSPLLGLVVLAGIAYAAHETTVLDSVRWRGTTQAKVITWDSENDRLTAADDVAIRYGTDADIVTKFDGTNFLTEPAATNTTWKIGTTSFGLRPQLIGPSRPIGFNALSTRYELKWVAGQRGKPALNAVIALDENSNAAAHLASNIADPDFEILGSNASTDDVTFYVEGGITIETDGGGTDAVIVLPHLDTDQTAWTKVTWGSDQQTEWECDFTTAADITAMVIHAGLKLTNTPTTATDDDQVFFRFAPATNSGEWQAISSAAGVDDAHDTNVAVAASTRYHLKITIDSSRIARFFVNGALVETSGALVTAKDFIPYIGILESEAVAKKIHIHGQSISRVIG